MLPGRIIIAECPDTKPGWPCPALRGITSAGINEALNIHLFLVFNHLSRQDSEIYRIYPVK